MKTKITDLKKDDVVLVDMGCATDYIGCIDDIDLNTGLITTGDYVGCIDDMKVIEDICFDEIDDETVSINVFFKDSAGGVEVCTIDKEQIDNLLIINFTKPEFQSLNNSERFNLEVKQICKDYFLRIPTEHDLENLKKGGCVTVDRKEYGVRKSIAKMSKPMQCEHCCGSFAVDADYLNKVTKLIFCPICGKHLNAEVNCKAVTELEK
jgi:hypothetical protein